MNKFYEAVSATVAPEREGVYDTELGQLEFEKNTDDGPGWYDHGCEEYKRPKYWLRPLPVPEGLPGEEGMRESAVELYHSDAKKIEAYVSGYKDSVSRFIPLIAKERAALIATENAHALCGRSLIVAKQTIASQQAEIERLKAELASMESVAHAGLPDDCIEEGWSDVKFCPHRLGDGGKCKWCSNFTPQP